MTRAQFYEQLSKTSEELDIHWSINSNGCIRGKKDVYDYCPITAVAALQDRSKYFNYFDQTDSAAEFLKLRNYISVADAADGNHCCGLSDNEIKIRKKLLEATGLDD